MSARENLQTGSWVPDEGDLPTIGGTAPASRPMVPASPDYGPAGKPSPGRVVRLHQHGKDAGIPADIYRVDPDTGLALLIFDVLGDVVQRLPVRDVPYGPQSDPDAFWWDYWPRV